MELILTDSNANFDRVAAQFAATRLFPDAQALLSTTLDARIRAFLALAGDQLPFVEQATTRHEPITRLILIGTSQAPPQAGDPTGLPTLIIDHRPLGRALQPHEQHFAGTIAGATTTLLVECMMERGLGVSTQLATLLLLGIYQSTQHLSYPYTQQADLACAAWLVGQGARMQAIAEFLAASPVPELRAETLMTRAIRTIPVDATIAQATAAQIRSGHQALPVIDANRVVHGLIGQRDLDLAMRHELGEALLANYMWRRPRLVAPETPLDELRRALLNDEGRSNACLLVVDAQQHLLGIITRADLLRAWAATQPHEEPHTDTSAVLERFLPAAIINILRQAAAQAEQRNEQLYLVGGAVRDMLLDRQPGDLDLVVEGDAIGLAEALAERLAGRVRSYLPFRTATLAIDLPTGMPIMLDFVTARKEFYQQPAALPEVDPASLRHDLHRRDFTINTLAICLNPSRYGRLYDFYGGQQDLQQRLVRVLHNLSFIDDPTRILRAARLAARLGCTIEPRTRALITDAVKRNLIGRTTPQRILTELLLVLAEPEPEHALALMDELAILPAICPSLIYSPDLPIWFQAARQLTLSPDQLVTLNLALLAYSSTPTLRARCITRYRLPTQQAQVLQDLGATQKAVPLLTEQNLPNSQIDRLLHDLHPIALTAAQIAEPSAAHAIQRYQTLLHSIQLDINGDDLRALGLTPGPHFRRLLNDLRAARLDGIVATREEQLDWIRQHA